MNNRSASNAGNKRLFIGALVAIGVGLGLAHLSRLGTRDAPSWSKNLHAKLIDFLAKRHKEDAIERRRKLFSTIPDGARVLEVGAGTGVNFQYLSYNNRTVHWTGIEPNPHMHEYLRNEAQKFAPFIDIERIVDIYAEDAQLDPESFDVVVTTHVLCSVEDVNKVVRAIHSALKPGGQYLFLEHVEAPQEQPWLKRFQHLIQPAWEKIGDGCHVTRTPQQDIADIFGEQNVHIERFKSLMPAALRMVEPHIFGSATKPAKN